MPNPKPSHSEETHILIGGGIASLAAAALLVRDAGVDGQRIHIIEQGETLGGSLDGSGDPERGYLTRGGRMFERHFACTFDLLGSIPCIDDSARSVAEDILAFNREVVSYADCRLVRDHRKVEDRHRLTLAWRDRAALARLTLASEVSLAGRTIESWFAESFFASNFWLLWSTMFAFTPWHSLVEMRRYMRRFIHLFPGLTSLTGVLRTRYNQYDTMIRPLQDWLARQGVTFTLGKAVSGIAITGDVYSRRVEAIRLEDGKEITVSPDGRVYITLGSMTDASSLGSNALVPARNDAAGPAWRLWQSLAQGQEGLGRPEAFCGDPQRTAWHSFTVTLDHRRVHDFMEDFSGCETGRGGLVTFADSGWLMSIVMMNQPHFRDQPDGTYMFWGYGLRGERPGDSIAKPMWEATGDEILSELAWQLGAADEAAQLFEGARIRTCRMPFITSQFMPRSPGDRPPVQPAGAENFALMGQYCEIERDCVFTVEYSVRSAWEAVHALTGRIKPPPPVARTDLDPLTFMRATRQLIFG